ncbi:hypothetical protein CMUS01_10342 [Colletotrichum musicola]|uniref:Secreted LysM effector LysM C-terminal domain-containing protein n=1 Tax=Colletotrichum musicola TaxID=2175873 RepID=A0A8H6K4D2_9PEZI|nr:hypothetical protein CMUS01_10342 [Colletotrichum musicola]
MQFSLASAVSLLAAVQTASAWQIIGYNGNQNCHDGYQNRVLRGGSAQNVCYTFGQSMPGVTCTHYARNGAPAEGCHGHLPINSIRVGTGQTCYFYRQPNCGGGFHLVDNKNTCAAGGGEFKSFKCFN